MRFISIKNLSILLFFLLFACSEKEEASLELSSENVTLNVSANYGSFMIISSGSWRIEVPQAAKWCSVTPLQGEGNMEVKIKGEPNNELTARETALAIMGGNITRTIRIIQPGSGLTVSIDPNSIFRKEGETKSIKVKTANESLEWNIIIPADNQDISITPKSGKGSKDIQITLGENPTKKARQIELNIQCNGKKIPFTLNQEAGDNHAPNNFSLNKPENNATDQSRVTVFKWQITEDPDGDPVSYQVQYSTDKSTWTTLEKTTKNECSVTNALSANTQYFWKVIASDDSDKQCESTIFSFTTGDKAMYPDGAWYIYDQIKDGTIPLIFIGDGFVANDYEQGGLFDKKADEGIEAFFATEPYKSYRNKFKVYKVVAHSQESGASRWNESKNDYEIHKNTAFDTRYYGNGYSSTYMTTNCDKVYQYALKIDGMNNAALCNTTVVLIINDPVYSGTCWMSTDGKSVSIVPTCGPSAPYTYKETMAHEAGGHGFGRLGDEYTIREGAATAEEIKNINNWIGYGANANLDTKTNRNEAQWKHFFGQSGYESVNYINGTQYTGGGVYRPEESSVMRNMKDLYYNAPSREAIVKRIKKNLGETWNFSQFMNTDKANQDKHTINVRSISVRSNYVELPEAHTPPQLYIPGEH